MILASITLFFTMITAFIFPSVSTHVTTADEVHKEDIKEPLQALAFTRVSTVSIKADPAASVSFERTAVKTIPAGPTPEEIAAEKARVEKAAAEKAAAEKAEADKVAAEKAAVAQQETLHYAAAQASGSSPAPSAGTRGPNPAPPVASGDVSVGASKAFARATLAARGMGDGEFQCLNNLWERESNWNYQAANPSSGAYGIPQSLPGTKMATIAPDWQVNPQTQILWGIGYIAERYGSPCNAWGHSEAIGWY